MNIKKILINVGLVLLLSFALVFALTVQSSLAEVIYIGTFDQNDFNGGNDPYEQPGDLVPTIKHWFDTNADGHTAPESWDWDTFAAYAKNEADNFNSTWVDHTTEEGPGTLSITANSFKDDPAEAIGGTFTTGIDIDFFALKAGNAFDLYWVNPASGNSDPIVWDTQNLQDKEISHISAYTINSVPLPGAAWLLGAGLLGLLGFKRKRPNRVNQAS